MGYKPHRNSRFCQIIGFALLRSTAWAHRDRSSIALRNCKLYPALMDSATAAPAKNRRRYARFAAPKGTFLAWQGGGQRHVSRVGEFSLGGMFVATANTCPVGTPLEVIFDVPEGEIRLRASIRNVRAGKGMGIGIIKMSVEHRARFDRFLKQLALQPAQSAADVSSNVAHAASKTTPRPAARPAAQAASRKVPAEDLAAHAARLLEFAHKRDFYGLLGVMPGTVPGQIRSKFYALARKFHPDMHRKNERLLPLVSEVMENLTEAYRTLSHAPSRARYDKEWAERGAWTLRGTKSESQRRLEEFLARAQDLLKVKNYPASILWLRKCVELDPANASCRVLLAGSLAAVPQYRAEAVQCFEKALELDPFNVAAHLDLAHLCRSLGLLSRSRSLCEKALELDPFSARAHSILAHLSATDAAKPR